MCRWKEGDSDRLGPEGDRLGRCRVRVLVIVLDWNLGSRPQWRTTGLQTEVKLGVMRGQVEGEKRCGAPNASFLHFSNGMMKYVQER